MKTFLTTEHTEYTERAIRNYELEITNNKCRLLRRNFWERQPWSHATARKPLAPPEAGKHLAGIFFNVAQARRLYHILLIKHAGKLPAIRECNSIYQPVKNICGQSLTSLKKTVIFALTIPAKPLTSGHAQIGGLLFFINHICCPCFFNNRCDFNISIPAAPLLCEIRWVFLFGLWLFSKSKVYFFS